MKNVEVSSKQLEPIEKHDSEESGGTFDVRQEELENVRIVMFQLV